MLEHEIMIEYTKQLLSLITIANKRCSNYQQMLSSYT